MREPQMNFDTHESIKFLMGKGFKETQAESIVNVVSKSREFDFSRLATKDQLDMSVIALRGEISELRTELRGEMATIREEIKSSKYDILKWLIPFLISILVSMMGLIITMLFKQ
jgi:hypothetical protein